MAAEAHFGLVGPFVEQFGVIRTVRAVTADTAKELSRPGWIGNSDDRVFPGPEPAGNMLTAGMIGMAGQAEGVDFHRQKPRVGGPMGIVAGGAFFQAENRVHHLALVLGIVTVMAEFVYFVLEILGIIGLVRIVAEGALPLPGRGMNHISPGQVVVMAPEANLADHGAPEQVWISGQVGIMTGGTFSQGDRAVDVAFCVFVFVTLVTEFALLFFLEESLLGGGVGPVAGETVGKGLVGGDLRGRLLVRVAGKAGFLQITP